MKDAGEKISTIDPSRKLSDAIRDVKTAFADRDDVVVGRVVLAESTEMKPVADQVTRYVAERVVERQRMMEGGAEPAVTGLKRTAVPEAEPPLRTATRGKIWSAFLSGLGLIAAGALVGLVASVVFFWDRILAMKISF